MSKTILVVEPNEDIRELLPLQLQSIDRMLDVLAVKDGERALAWLERTVRFTEHFDILIVGREMLGMPVENIIKKFRDLHPVLWIVVTTTSPFEDETICAMTKAGADVVLWKPWDMKELREALQI